MKKQLRTLLFTILCAVILCFSIGFVYAQAPDSAQTKQGSNMMVARYTLTINNAQFNGTVYSHNLDETCFPNDSEVTRQYYLLTDEAIGNGISVQGNILFITPPQAFHQTIRLQAVDALNTPSYIDLDLNVIDAPSYISTLTRNLMLWCLGLLLILVFITLCACPIGGTIHIQTTKDNERTDTNLLPRPFFGLAWFASECGIRGLLVGRGKNRVKFIPLGNAYIKTEEDNGEGYQAVIACEILPLTETYFYSAENDENFINVLFY